MLVLSRHEGERIVITIGGQECRLVVTKVQGDVVKIGFEAERSVSILRGELVGTPPAGSRNAEADAARFPGEQQAAEPLTPNPYPRSTVARGEELQALTLATEVADAA